MTPVSYYVPGQDTSPRFAFAFAKGCNGTITDEAELFPGPVALFTVPERWELFKKAEAEGRTWYYADHAYLGRHRFYRITRNAYQHDGTGDYPPERFLSFRRPVQPWRTNGAHILICPQSPIYCQMHGFDVMHWIRDVTATLRTYTTRPIRVRWKKQRDRSIAQDLINAWAVVVYSSAAALDALIAGIPVFVLAPFAAAYRMGLPDLAQIESPVFPDGREPFLWALACNQWTLPEIYTGVAWRALQEAS